MKVGIVGCGYVFDLYMETLHRHPDIEIVGVADRDGERVAAVCDHYGLTPYAHPAALIADASIELVVNLTSIGAHYAVTKAALEAGKHVYSEKPFATTLAETQELIDLAEARGLRVACAPSNVLGATSQTLWKAVIDGAVGDVRLVYAEFDDNPIYLMQPETWRSGTGAPWPYRHEYEMGCTWEHAGYHLSWMCAILGPVRTITAFSREILPDKTEHPLDPAGTPDFSVACLEFESGAVGRLTCSIAAPLDHRMRIIGNRGVLRTDTYRDYAGPVFLEPFLPASINARRARVVRESTLLQWLFGVGGRRIPLAPAAAPGRRGTGAGEDRPRWSPAAALARWKRRQYGQQDKCAGIAELVDAVAAGRPHFPSHAFTLHQTELVLAIQAAGPRSCTYETTTRFEPPTLPATTWRRAPDYGALTVRPPVERLRPLRRRLRPSS